MPGEEFHPDNKSDDQDPQQQHVTDGPDLNALREAASNGGFSSEGSGHTHEPVTEVGGEVLEHAGVEGPEITVHDNNDASSEKSSTLEQLHADLLEVARATEAEVDVSGFTGEQREFDSFKNLLRAGDKEAIERALQLIDNPDSRFFGKSDDSIGSRKQLAYRDLAVAAYEAGLAQEGDELASKVQNKSMMGPLLFAKAEATETGVPELVEQFGKASLEDYKLKFEKLTYKLISQERMESARAIVEVLSDKRKFKVLLELVKAGETDLVESARETARELRGDLGGGQKTGEGPSAEENRIRALLNLYDAGDEVALTTAFEVAQSSERHEFKLALLGWLGSEINKREKRKESEKS
jgi:hypothetical protein